nr:hypothetical protein [uncultured Oscillibacter sp.]
MNDYNNQPLSSMQNTTPETNTSRNSNKSGGGCGGALLKLFFFLIVISLVFRACNGDSNNNSNSKVDGPPEASPPSYVENPPTSDLTPVEESPVQDSVPTDTEESNAEMPESELSEMARNIEQLYFHGAYTDLGTVTIHDFKERDGLLEQMAYFLSSEDALNGEVPVAKESKLFGNDYWYMTSNSSDYSYIGDIKDGKPDGFGMLLYIYNGNYNYQFKGEPGICYVGNFKDGMFDGYGAAFVVGDSDISSAVSSVASTGLLSEDEGELLVEYLFNYVLYEGYFRENKVNGKANYFYFPTYQEQMIPFHEQPIDGYIWANAYPYVTMGEYVNGELTGDAMIYKFNQLVYDGEVKKDEYHGTGTSYYYNGQVEYSGDWKNGMRHGKGAYYDTDGTLIYDGKWENDDYAH